MYVTNYKSVALPLPEYRGYPKIGAVRVMRTQGDAVGAGVGDGTVRKSV